MEDLEKRLHDKNTRRQIALLMAKFDPDLKAALEEQGCSEEVQEEKFKIIETGIKRGYACKLIRDYLRKTLNKRAFQLADEYISASNEWVESKPGKYNLPYPPQLGIQRLPQVNEKTLGKYFEAFEKITSAIQTTRNSLPAMNSAAGASTIMAMSEKSLPDSSQELLALEGTKDNLFCRLEEYINADESNALRILTHTLLKRSETEDPYFTVEAYLAVFKRCLKRLKNNKHLIGSLVNLMYEEVFRATPELNRGEPLTGRHSFNLFIEGLKSINLAKEVGADSFEIRKPGMPREVCHFSYIIISSGKMGVIAIPSEYGPVSWNEHRLVDPRKNENFTLLAAQLENDTQTANPSDREEELAHFKDELNNNRRYGLDFARMKVTEIPCPEGVEVWLHYSYDQDLPEGFIGVELILEDPKTKKAVSVAYVLDQDLKLIPPSHLKREYSGKIFHPVRPENTGSLDLIKKRPPAGSYASAEHMQFELENVLATWPSEAGQKALQYYFSKYAYYLLVKERNVGEKKERESNPSFPEHALNLSLTEHESEVIIPSLNSGDRFGLRSTEQNLTIYHQVSGYKRRLKKGQTASQEAIEKARRMGIILREDETFVDTHHRGSVFTKQKGSAKKTRGD